MPMRELGRCVNVRRGIMQPARGLSIALASSDGRPLHQDCGAMSALCPTLCMVDCAGNSYHEIPAGWCTGSYEQPGRNAAQGGTYDVHRVGMAAAPVDTATGDHPPCRNPVRWRGAP